MIIQGALFKECDHRHTLVVPEKQSSIHHAKEVCADCKKFLRWIPKPETIYKRALNIAALTLLAKREDLSEWEREFIRNIARKEKLSPKQQKFLDDLRLKYLEPHQQ